MAPAGLGALLAVLALVFGSAAAALAAPVSIVAFGDSNTYGYGVDRDKTYPAQLEAVLQSRGYEVTIKNAGINGDMTAEGIARLEKSIPADADAVIVFLGRNDWRKGVPAVTISHNLETIVKSLRAADKEVLLVGFAPNDFSAVAQRNDALYYDNFFDGTTRFGRKLRRYKLRGDIGAHLNSNGYAVVVKGMTPTVEALIAKVNGGTATN